MPGTRPHASRVSSEQGFEQVVGRLQSSAQRMHRAVVLGVVGCRSGDGATFVLEALARQLTTKSRKRVLQTDCRDLFGASGLSAPELISHCCFTDQPGRWRLSAPRGMRVLPDAAPEGDLRSAFKVLDSQFDFLLLDCAPVTSSGWLWQLAPFLDDLLLVVAAGETTRNQVLYAQRLIEQAGARLSGCILNKRSYPLPNVIHRLLS